jgi:uncharacterized membrane protein
MRDAAVMSEMRYVLAAAYDDVETALAEYQALEVAFKHVGVSKDFDATVVAKQPDGQVEIVSRHDESKREGTASGLGWGLATGAVAALFPAVGIVSALAIGGGAGAAIGALTHRAASGMSREDLKALGEVLDQGHAGLVAVYGPDMADRVGDAITHATSHVRATTDVSHEQLAADLRKAEDAADASSHPV